MSESKKKKDKHREPSLDRDEKKREKKDKDKEKKDKDKDKKGKDKDKEKDKDKKDKDKKDKDKKDKDKKNKRGKDSRSPSPPPQEVPFQTFKDQFMQMTTLGKTAVSTAVKNVELRLANVQEFKTMFLEELDVVLNKLASLRQMLEANRYNDETKMGFITI